MSPSFAELCGALGYQHVAGDAEIGSVTHDSRRAQRGSLFVASRGATERSADGHDFIEQAVASGASAVVAERLDAPIGVPHALVGDSRVALAKFAEALNGHPSRKLKLVGVTGTNGKTTVVHMVAAALEACGLPCGALGTLGVEASRTRKAWSLTTPEAPELSESLAELVREGAKAAAMEVSSHALALRRADGLSFAAVAFTNLSQDHLDFHGDMQSYLEAKQRLFFELMPGDGGSKAVVHVGDPAGKALADQLGGRAIRVGIGDASSLDVAASRVRLSARGTDAEIRIGERELTLRSRHTGTFNLENSLVAIGLAKALDLDLERAIQGISTCSPTPGRLERVSDPGELAVFVDYSHTPQALERALRTLGELGTGEMLVVFGCGGERDPHKRGPMGEVAARCADTVIITDDNPRREPGDQIVAAIEDGARKVAEPRAKTILVQRDRRAAIATAIEAAGPDDCVLVAGKGHEAVQISGDQTRPFSDRDVARELLRGGSE